MRPEDMTGAYLYLYDIICADGRGEQLFGSPDFDLLQQSLGTGMLLSDRPTCYLEFPLYGEPAMDLLISHSTGNGPMRQSASSVPYYPAFAAAATHKRDPFACGLEWDLSRADVSAAGPGFYIDHANDHTLMDTVLQALRVPERRSEVNYLYSCLPDGWNSYYLGLFPNRPGTPVRLGFTVCKEKTAFYRENPSRLIQDLCHLGYGEPTPSMLSEILDPVYAPFFWDVQLDLFPGGALGPDLGLSYYLYNGRKNESLVYFCSEPIRRFFRHLEDCALVDGRWKLLPDCLVSRQSWLFADGKPVRLALENRLNFLKIKWRKGEPMGAKFYFECRVSELPEQE